MIDSQPTSSATEERLQKLLPKKDMVRLNQLLKRKKQIESWRNNIFLYAEERLVVPRETLIWSLNAGYENHKWDGDKDPFEKAAQAMYNHSWVGIQSATGIGKTFFLAIVAYWFLECWEDSIVVISGPKQEQLALHIWQELAKMYPKFGAGQLMNLKLRMSPDAPEDQGWEIVAFGAGVKADEIGASAKRAQGFHREHMLIILEECTGIPAAVITAFENTSVAPHNIIIAVGNPDHELDSLARFINQNKKRIVPIRISGFDHPNVVTKNPILIPGAQSEMGLAGLLDRYRDPENGMYLSRARGISPKQAIDSLIKLPWLFAASARLDKKRDEAGRVDLTKILGLGGMGIDASNSEGGDPACVGRGKGNNFLEADAFQCPDSNELGRIVRRRMTAFSIVAQNVAVDGIGVGAGTVNTLKELGQKVYNFQSSSTKLGDEDLAIWRDGKKQEEKFLNLRALAWWLAREDLRLDLVDVIQDEEMFAELIAPTFTTRDGKILVQPKDEVRHRLGRSPNKADAFVMWNFIRQYGTTVKRSTTVQFAGATY